MVTYLSHRCSLQTPSHTCIQTLREDLSTFLRSCMAPSDIHSPVLKQMNGDAVLIAQNITIKYPFTITHWQGTFLNNDTVVISDTNVQANEWWCSTQTTTQTYSVFSYNIWTLITHEIVAQRTNINIQTTKLQNFQYISHLWLLQLI